MTLPLVAPVAAVGLLLLAVGGVAAWYVHRLSRNTAEVMAIDVRSVRAAEELVITLQETRALLDRYLDDGSPTHLEALAAQRERADRWLGEIGRLSATPRERALVDGLNRAALPFWAELEDAARSPVDRADLVRLLRDGVRWREVYAPARQYLDDNEEVLERTSRENLALPAWVASGLILLGACGSVAGLVAGYGIARTINQSIVRLSVPIREAAGRLGEVVGPITVESVRGVGDIEGALRRLAEEVGTVVDRLEQSRLAALRAEQLAALGQLAAGLAHELRNPLTSMKMLVQSAARKGDEGGLRGRSLAVVEEEVVRLERAIQAFLDFARPPAPEHREFDLRELVDRAATLLTGRAEARGVTLDVVDAGGPVPLEADPGQVRQVLLNLAINAVDATPEGGSVRIEAGGDGDRVRLRVADRGVGLPAALGARIFEPFVGTKEGGLGLGLAICRRIVEAHGGTIEAGDRPGGGADFVVILPRGGRGRPGPDVERGEDSCRAC